MKNTVRVPLFVLALILAAPAFATTPADNIAWSAKPVQRFVMPRSVTPTRSGRFRAMSR